MQLVKVWPDLACPPEKFCEQCGEKATPRWHTDEGFDENTGKHGVTYIELELVCPIHKRVALFVWRENHWAAQSWGGYGMI